MKTLALAVVVLVLPAVVLPSVAAAKGPIEASLDGPGLGAPIEFGGWTEPGADDPGRAPVGRLAEAAGFFPAAFGQTPDPMLAERPEGDLGPRYTLTYGLGGPESDKELIVQDVYPYAKPNPVTYMAPGQRFYETMSTRGGWFIAASPVAAPPLMYILAEAGLPTGPPGGGAGSPFPWTLVGAIGASAAVLVLAALATLAIRRRPQAAATR